jgi:hypothetical protein
MLNTRRIEETVIPMMRSQFINRTIEESFYYILKKFQKINDENLMSLVLSNK